MVDDGGPHHGNGRVGGRAADQRCDHVGDEDLDARGGGGTETDIAYLGDYLALVTVVTDPGPTQPQLPPDFASTFLVRVVATLQG